MPRYQCTGGNRNHGVENCINFGGWRADEAIASVVIEALQPLSIEAALQAWDAAQAQQGVQRNSITLALEKARYEADRTRRQYELVDPANRLVAAELESRWNLALQQVAEVENRLKQLDTVTPAMGEPERQRLMSLADAANELAVSAGVVRRLIEEKVLPAKQVVPCAPWMIRQEDLALGEVQRRITAIRQGKRAPRSDDRQTALPLITTT